MQALYTYSLSFRLTCNRLILYYDWFPSSTLNSASMHIFLGKCGLSRLCFSFFICLLLLCVCTHLSLSPSSSQPAILIFFLCSSGPLSWYWYMMQWNKTWQLPFFSYSIPSRLSPLLVPLSSTYFHSVVFLLLLFLLLCVFTFLLVSVFLHLSYSFCLSSCSSLPSLESSSFRLFSLTRFIFSSNYSTRRPTRTAACTHTHTHCTNKVMLAGAAVPRLHQSGSLWHCDRAIEGEERLSETA